MLLFILERPLLLGFLCLICFWIACHQEKKRMARQFARDAAAYQWRLANTPVTEEVPLSRIKRAYLVADPHRIATSRRTYVLAEMFAESFRRQLPIFVEWDDLGEIKSGQMIAVNGNAYSTVKMCYSDDQGRALLHAPGTEPVVVPKANPVTPKSSTFTMVKNPRKD